MIKMDFDPRCKCRYGYNSNYICTVNYHECMCCNPHCLPCKSKLHKCSCDILLEYGSSTSQCLFLGYHKCVCILRHGIIGKGCLRDEHKCCCHIDPAKCISTYHNCSCNPNKLGPTNNPSTCRKTSDHNCSCVHHGRDTCKHKKCHKLPK